MKKTFLAPVYFLLICNFISVAQTNYYGIDLDTVKAQKFDMGKMWTFENPPLKYFENVYNFKPSKEWLDKVQKSALKFGDGCSASFISEDGLIMTNHHCVRGRINDFQKEGEDLLKTDFYAKTPEEERKIPGLYVEQLLVIKDVTEEIKSAMDESETDSAKLARRDEKINEIKAGSLKENPGLTYKIISLYNGGRYSLYGYKVYNDIRLVFLPELQIAHLGGDYDNFTYPRYCLDCAFLRAYDENGKPVKCDNYFSWSTEPVYDGDPLFVVGNPGSTDRIHTIAQLEYDRDYRFGLQLKMRRELYNVYEKLVEKTRAENSVLISSMFGVGNTLKVYEYTYKYLSDPYLIARKKDFEKEFKAEVQSSTKLDIKYGHIWDKIEENRRQASAYAKEIFGLTINKYYSSVYFIIAQDLVKLAEQMKLPEDNREPEYRAEKLESLIQNIFPKRFNKELEDNKVLVQLNVLSDNLGSDNKIVKEILGDKTTDQAAKDFLLKTNLYSKENVTALVKAGADAILNSNDPFIQFVLKTRDRLAELKKQNKKLDDENAISSQHLGEALYEVYGNEYPPDATGTLRISDGVVKSYEYNGTIAPIKTTFYGSLDRYFSFNKEFPFILPPVWEKLPKEFDLNTTLDFISTNDIIGGNSGSAVINTKAEVVGVAFDGNIESHSGRFIFTTEANRTVSVSAEGMLEAIRDLYKADRLATEILNGKIK